MNSLRSKTTGNEGNDAEILSGRNDKMPSLLFCLSAALAAISVLTSCNDYHTFFHSLSPDTTYQDCSSYRSREGYCTGLDKWGTACSGVDGVTIPKDKVWDLGGKSPIVGFTKKFYPGTQPFPCKEVYRWKSRAYVTFDLHKLSPKIESPERLAIATLSWEPATKRFEQGWAESKNIPPHCFGQLYVRDSNIQSFDNPGTLVADLDQNWVGAPPQKITVTPFVKKYVGVWVTFCFTGSDEGDYGQENRSCNTTLNSLRLDVTYAAK